MRFWLSFLTLFLTVFGFAQTCEVTGIVVNKANKSLDFILVKCKNANPTSTRTNPSGEFKLIVSQGDTVTLIFDQIGSSKEVNLVIAKGETSRQIGKVVLQFQEQDSVEVTQKRFDPFELPTKPFGDLQKIPMGGVEKFLVYTTAAVSNNELTSNYNVRGGNYDENLVYVNGFLIYRPFLTRSGQQEGMSFVNTALVEEIAFSAGGFDAGYGDKLSSVLDIKYRKPIKFRASATASLLGVEAHVEQAIGPRFSYLVGARYRANGYLLNSLPAKGAYNPVFADAQFVTNFAINEKLNWSVLGHYSSNDYRFAPQTQRTDFGTVNEAYSFLIYYEGQEQTKFLTGMGGTSLKYKPNDKTNLDFYATVFRSVEREYFDILGEYFINELETDPGKEEFGDSIANVGIGGFLNHARNKLDATIINVYHNGDYELKSGFRDEEENRFFRSQFKWGVNVQRDQFDDVLSEWRLIDSAGYSKPQTNPNEAELFETIKGKLQLKTFRATSFLQLNSIWTRNEKNYIVNTQSKFKDTLGNKTKINYQDTVRESASRLALNVGLRGGYTDINQEFYVTPRASLTYFPRVYMRSKGELTRRDVRMRLATGLYYQPPFYREFRTFEGELNLNVKSQKSFHAVAGTDIYVNIWERESPFKIGVDVYYKYLWDVNPYEIDNVRTRYFAENNAVAYAYGLDFNMNGQFVKGIESYFKFGLMSTKEDILNDQFTEYFNSDKEKIIFGYTFNDSIVDSTVTYPGYVPRPTEQFFTFGALIQDQMPKFESFTVQLGLQFGSALPYGPPDRDRYKDTLRLKSYFRTDIGFSYDFLYKKRNKLSTKENFFTKNFNDAILSFEVFNLLGINNVLSKQWIQDVNGLYYAVPNNLTARRFNLKLILRM
ncbi:MAG: hypothetical protein P8P77_03795 [Crocinitomicaceae bacterium]|nr:hypothetical protein [Crocinitomicaceae bacterium]